jgi:transposase InsO family protein
LSASIGTVGDAHDNAAAKPFIGLFKNEAITAESPFRTRPLRTLADVEAITMNYVDWYNNDRLHSLLDLATREEFETPNTLTTPAHRPATPPTRSRHETRGGSV